MIIMATILTFSRVYVGLYYLFDVLGDILIAFVTSVIVQRFSKLFNKVADFTIGF